MNSCAGVVYRLKDTSVVVAVDDVPEEGLDQPLRMEKLANEVRSSSVKAFCAMACTSERSKTRRLWFMLWLTGGGDRRVCFSIAHEVNRFGMETLSDGGALLCFRAR